jgi:hypothetical protein
MYSFFHFWGVEVEEAVIQEPNSFRSKVENLHFAGRTSNFLLCDDTWGCLKILKINFIGLLQMRIILLK